MFVLHVLIEPKSGEEITMEEIFAGPFKAAIATQPGFHSTELLRPIGDKQYLLSIAFESQPHQQKWVATDLHADVWSAMEAHFTGYSLKTYTAV